MGTATDIQHQLGDSPTSYETGDGSFKVGTIITGVTKGWPGKIQEVNKNNFKTIFGTPLRNSDDAYHAWFALHNTNTIGKYIRVVADDAKYPYISYSSNDSTEPAVSQSTFDTEVGTSGDIVLIAYVKNGDTKSEYGIQIANKDLTKKTFEVVVHIKQSDGSSKELERHLVGLDIDSKTMSGKRIYIESVVENESEIINFKLSDTLDFAHIKEHEVKWLTGATAGTTAITSTNKEDAWKLFKDDDLEIDQIFMAGDITETTIAVANDISVNKDIQLEADAPNGLATASVTFVKGLSIQNHNISITHGRISFNDPFYKGCRKLLSYSGFATACKGFARDASKTISDPSVWEAPAGDKFGLIRGATGVRNETSLDRDDKTLLAENWINYAVNGPTTGVILWEQFTLFGEDCPYAYKDNIAVINYVYKEHKRIIKKLQFRKKTDEEVIEDLSAVLDRFQNKEILREDPNDEDMPEAYKIEIKAVGTKKTITRAMRILDSIGPVTLRTVAY